MSLTIGDANDVQTIARFFAHLKIWEFTVPAGDVWHPDEPEVARALMRLTDRANARLGAGFTGKLLAGNEAVLHLLEQVDENHRGAE